MTRVLAAVAFVAALALALAPAEAARKKRTRVVADPQNTILMETTKGSVTIVLRTDIAPQHAERIKTLTREKFYDNAPFHRVIEGFMAQTGDGVRGDGTGKSKYPDLPAEFAPKVKFKRGFVGMARGANPNSANCQFFITFDDAPHLDGQYTVIGTVIKGMEVVDKLKKGSPTQNGAVTDPDKIVRMQVAADKAAEAKQGEAR